MKSRKNRRKAASEGGDQPDKVKVVDGVVFVYYIKDSALRDRLKKAEEVIARELRVPSARFVERGGRTVANTLGMNNIWKQEGECP